MQVEYYQFFNLQYRHETNRTNYTYKFLFINQSCWYHLRILAFYSWILIRNHLVNTACKCSKCSFVNTWKFFAIELSWISNAECKMAAINVSSFTRDRHTRHTRNLSCNVNRPFRTFVRTARNSIPCRRIKTINLPALRNELDTLRL